MSHFSKTILSIIAAGVALIAPAQSQNAPDITRQPTLYVVPYAHLDTQWRWEFPQTISEYLLKTMKDNFYYIDKYPHYIFNWTGANRYRLMKEYYPADYARMKRYVAEGRWYPAGSSVEEGDVNLPSAESILRQILYGNTYFREEFGKASNEFMLPDCFGFPASLPTILAHAGIKGFSTQKLGSDWQPAPIVGGPTSPEETPHGIPFNVGIWQGPDGETVIAALNPLEYVGGIRYDLSKTPPPLPAGSTEAKVFGASSGVIDWVKRIDIDGRLTGVYADYHYIGTGDTGGATDEESIKLLEALTTKGSMILPPPDAPSGAHALAPPEGGYKGPEVRVGDGPVRVLSTAADQMFRDITLAMTEKMPRYQGDLELINHSAGSLTSETYHRRWNRENEILADGAEKASIAAAWMGGRPYPQQRLNDAWMLVMSGQFHDIAAGTATPRAYQFTQNDDVIAMNQFADVVTSATESIASALNTQGKGVPVIVYNSLNIPREDIVEADIKFPDGMPLAVNVIGPDGNQVPAQIEDGKVVFLARTPSVGYAVYDVRRAARADTSTELKVTSSSLENARYRVTLNAAGDVGSIFDKQLNKELLSGPMRLAISNDAPTQWPAWNMDFDQEQAAPRAYVSGPAKVRIVEEGPARVAIEVSRGTEGARFVQTVRLSAGDAGNRVEFSDVVDWRTRSANLKAVFPLTASNPMATYNWEIGTIERPTAFNRQFEVATHHWIDLTDKSGSYGTTILTGVKDGSDKRNDHTIRLTLMRTPGAPQPGPGGNYPDQLSQDWGHHEILYGLAAHAGNWRQGDTDWQAYRLSTPLMAFTTARHAGELGRSYSLVGIDNPHIRILALKKAEMSNEVIVRMVELDGEAAPDVKVKFAGPVIAAREVNGQELPVGPATIDDGVLKTSFKPYQPRTFALRLGRAPAVLSPVASQPVELKYNLAAASNDDTRSVGGFDREGDALPAEMLPGALYFNGIEFHLAPAATGKLDAVIAQGQTIQLPPGDFNRVYVLAASSSGDQNATFRAGNNSAQFTVENWGGFIGQWDTRVWKPAPESVSVGDPPQQVKLRKDWAVSANHATWNDRTYNGSPWWVPRYPQDYLGLSRGYIKRATLAWYASHHHTPDGLNEPYQYSYLFAYSMKLPAHTTTLTLPKNDSIRILAISVAYDSPEVIPVQPLYDTLEWHDSATNDYIGGQ